MASARPTTSTATSPTPGHHQIWLVTGPAGSGKSTVAKHLASSLNYPYIEGDEVAQQHPLLPSRARG